MSVVPLKMVPTLDLDALSGICGSISIACWVVVFSPQIVENFRRSSAEGLSITFVVIWLAGDVFNILGAVLQGVLPTMIILAVYYTLADIVLLAQCFYYRGFTFKDEVHKPVEPEPTPTETTTLLPPTAGASSRSSSRRSSFLAGLDATHFSPATPLHPAKRDEDALKARSSAKKRSVAKMIFFNATSVLVVCAAGIFGWWLSTSSTQRTHHRHQETEVQHENELHFNVLGQVFGYICAALYLGSRVPQLLLNYRRKSTEGISMLFFLFACIGNLTYVMSIVIYKPICHHPGHCREGEAKSVYGRYFLLNLSWLLGSFGTLFLDAGVFVQYFMYKNKNIEGSDCAVEDL